jgi:hypothetical protein
MLTLAPLLAVAGAAERAPARTVPELPRPATVSP